MEGRKDGTRLTRGKSRRQDGRSAAEARAANAKDYRRCNNAAGAPWLGSRDAPGCAVIKTLAAELLGQRRDFLFRRIRPVRRLAGQVGTLLRPVAGLFAPVLNPVAQAVSFAPEFAAHLFASFGCHQ